MRLQKERGAHTAKLSMGDDGNTIAQDVCLIHVMGGKDDGTT